MSTEARFVSHVIYHGLAKRAFLIFNALAY